MVKRGFSPSPDIGHLHFIASIRFYPEITGRPARPDGGRTRGCAGQPFFIAAGIVKKLIMSERHPDAAVGGNSASSVTAYLFIVAVEKIFNAAEQFHMACYFIGTG